MDGAPVIKDGMPSDLGASDRGHEVHYYEHSRFLVGRVTDFIAPGLDAGEAAIVIATPKHADLITAALTARGIDVDAAAKGGALVTLDAVHTLGRFMIAGRPDPALFQIVIGSTIEAARAKAKAPIVRAFGEMVAVLWAQGRPSAALALEDLWNRLLGHHPFSLLCGYPIVELDASDIEKVTSLHTRAHSPDPEATP
jgi:hypothetical protein